jgi:lipoate-protein ligase B
MAVPICEVHLLGLMDYQEAWELQNQFVADIAEGERLPTLLLLEHPHTYTFGRRGNSNNLLWDQAELQKRGITVHWVDRGGDVTYHGPGQLVGYPLLALGRPSIQASSTLGGGNHFPKTDYVGYIRKLEQTLISTVGEFGIEARQVEGLTGVWVDLEKSAILDRSPGIRSLASNQGRPHLIAKLAAIGVKVDAYGISRHGFALNIDPDMGYWEGIIGCGLSHPEISLAQFLNPVPSMDLVINAVIEAFGTKFNYRFRYVE